MSVLLFRLVLSLGLSSMDFLLFLTCCPLGPCLSGSWVVHCPARSFNYWQGDICWLKVWLQSNTSESKEHAHKAAQHAHNRQQRFTAWANNAAVRSKYSHNKSERRCREALWDSVLVGLHMAAVSTHLALHQPQPNTPRNWKCSAQPQLYAHVNPGPPCRLPSIILKCQKPC